MCEWFLFDWGRTRAVRTEAMSYQSCLRKYLRVKPPEASMSVIETKAKTLSKDVAGAGVTFDWTVIVTIITELLKMLAGCGLMAPQAEAEMNHPKALTKLMLRRKCRQHTANHDDAEVLEAACLDAGAALTTPEVSAMYKEIGK